MENKENKDWKQGLSDRYIAQIIRRMMITKSKPSKKIYSRKGNSKNKFGDSK
jgi:hypothetical protein